MKKYFLILMLTGLFLSGVYLGNFLWNQKPVTKETTKQTILTGLKNEGFLVSQTFVLNQTVEISKSTGSKWKDIFWGQDIEASGVVKVSAGVDLNQLTAQDVVVDKEKITVSLPKVTVSSVELLNGINVKNKQGLLKRVFDNDDGYNEAFELLRSQATKIIEGAEFQKSANDSATNMVKKFIRFVDKDKEVVVKIK